MQHDSFGEGKQEGLFKRIYLFITTQQKDQRPLTLSVKAQEARNTCNTQSTKHREIDKSNKNQTLHIKPHAKKPSTTHKITSKN